MIRFFASLVSLAVFVPAAEAVDPVPHQAVYELSMVRRASDTGIAGVRGTMAYEWSDACDAWVVEQRFVLDYSFQEGEGLRFTSDFSSWETKAGTAYRFSVARREDGQMVEEIRGSAELEDAEGGTARYAEPEVAEVVLPPDTVLPTEHLLRVVTAAEAGERFVVLPMFDGSEAGTAEVRVSAVIGRPVEPSPAAEGVAPGLVAGPAWPVRLAFFDPESAEALPDYEMTLWLHANGVVSRLRLDYPEFSLEGGLTGARALDARC